MVIMFAFQLSVEGAGAISVFKVANALFSALLGTVFFGDR